MSRDPMSQPLMGAHEEEEEEGEEQVVTPAAAAATTANALWDAEAGAAGASKAPLSVASLQGTTPEQALSALKENGVRTLGTMTVVDQALQEALGHDNDDLLTLPASSIEGFDWKHAWTAVLAQPAKSSKKGG